MNKVLLYWKKTSEDEAWAIQFAGDDPGLVSFYAPTNFPPGTNLPDFPIRKRVPISTQTPTWAAFMQGLDDAAALAGRDGLIFLLGGHGGSRCVNKADRLDPRCKFEDVGTVVFDPDFRLNFNQDIVNYRNLPRGSATATVIDPKTLRPKQSLHDEDMNALLSRKIGRVLELGDSEDLRKRRHWTAQQRWEAWSNYDRIGKILRYRQIYRIVFLSCVLGASPDFMESIARDWGVQVAAFKFHVTVIPPGKYKDEPKARFVLARDISEGQGTNTPWARVFTPSLDDDSIAYVAKPVPNRLFFDLEVRVPFPGPGNQWGTMSEWRQMNRASGKQ